MVKALKLKRTMPTYILVDFLCITASFWLPYFFRYNDLSNLHTTIYYPNFSGYCFIFVLELVLVIVVFKNRKLYSTDRQMTIPQELWRVVTHGMYLQIVICSIIFFSHYLFFSRFVLMTNIMLLCVLLGGWRTIKRLILRKLISEGFRNVNVLIVGSEDSAKMILKEIKTQPYYGFKVVGRLDSKVEENVGDVAVLGGLSDFALVVQKYFVDEVIIVTLSDKDAVSELITLAQNLRLGLRVVFEQPERTIPVLSMEFFGTLPLLTYKKRELHPSESVAKKTFDLVVSAVMIVLLLPAMIVIAILIKVSSLGPIFFIQKRVGFKGKVFNFYKFRSMLKNADQLKEELLNKNEMSDDIMFKIKNDPRVTKLGKFLRKYSLDELPQLINVIKGDMSLVGPRPPLPSEIQKYGSSHMERLSIKPGITGLSQTRGRSELSFSRWFKWDIWYINNWSFALDMRILLWTLPAVLKGKGAY